MSITSVRDALEIKLNAMTPVLAIAWENVGYTPVTGTPYQAAYLMPATPSNPTVGDGFYREQGIFQVSLFYPLLSGTQAAEARAEKIQKAFKRGTSVIIEARGISWDNGITWDDGIIWELGKITATIDTTPYIGQGRVDGDRWHIPVKIRYSAGIIA